MSVVAMTDMTGVGAAEMTPSSNDEFIAELNDLVRPAAWPWVLIVTLCLMPFLGSMPGLRVFVLVVGLVLALTLLISRARHTVNLQYEVQGQIASWHSEFRSQWPAVTQVGAIWRVAERGATQPGYQKKVNAGASHVVGRTRAATRSAPHRRVKSNIQLPTITAGTNTITFLPDHILIRSGGAWSDIAYSAVQVGFRKQRFIEDGPLPKDSQQIDTTWRYVNKSGGPDRRFKDNRQLPVMLYGEVELTSSTGLRWLMHISDPGAGGVLARVLATHPSSGRTSR